MDGWGDVGGWDDDADDSFLRPVAVISSGSEDGDYDLLNTRAQEACDDAGIADTLREMYRVNLAATTIQMVWRNFSEIRREKKRRADELQRQRKEQKLNLFSWAEDQRTQWDVIDAWRPSGATSGGAFTKFEAMDWSERQDQLWQTVKFFIERGLWVPGKNGALTEKQMQEILKMEAGWISAVSGASDGFGKFEYMSWAADVQGSLSGQKGPAWGRGGGRVQGTTWQPGPEPDRAPVATPTHRSAAASHPGLPERHPGKHAQEDSPSLRPQRSFLPRKDSVETRAAMKQPRDPPDPPSPGEDPQRRTVARDERSFRSPRGNKKLTDKVGGNKPGPQSSWTPPEDMSLVPVSGTRPPRDHKHALEKRAASRQSQRQVGRQDRVDSKPGTPSGSAAQPSPTRVPPPGAVRPASYIAPQKLTKMISALDPEQADQPSQVGDFFPREDAPSVSPQISGAAATTSSPRQNPSPQGAQDEGGASVPPAVTNLARNNDTTTRVASASSASSSGSEMSPSGYGRHRLPSLDTSLHHRTGSDEVHPSEDRWRISADSEESIPASYDPQPRRRQIMIRTTSLVPSDRAQTHDQATVGPAAHATSWLYQIQEANNNAGGAAKRQGRGSSGSSRTSGPSQHFSPRSSAGDQVHVSEEMSPPYFGSNDMSQEHSNLALVTGRSIQTAHTRYASPEARRRRSSTRPPKAESSKSSPTTPSNPASQQNRGFFQLPGSPSRPPTPTSCAIDMHIPLKHLSVFQGIETQKSMSTSRQNTLGRSASRGAFGTDLRMPDGRKVIRGKLYGTSPMKKASSMVNLESAVISSPMVVREWQPYLDRGQQQSPQQPGPVIHSAIKPSPIFSAAAKRAWWQPERTPPVSFLRRPADHRARNSLDSAVRSAVYKSARAASPRPEPLTGTNIRHTVLLREKPAAVALSEHRRRMGL